MTGYTEHIAFFQKIGVVLLTVSLSAGPDDGARAGRQSGALARAAASHSEAARLFFSGQYQASADMALQLRSDAPEDLATFEQRSSALHFQLQRELSTASDPRDKRRSFRECEACPSLVEAITADVTSGRALARKRLQENPADIDALFFLGKLNLTHVWLHNETLGQRKGWSEYREARRVLDDVLERDPDHVRARIAHAWIDYVVDTRVPWAFRWMLGGGNKKRALATVREAAMAHADAAVQAEARFALWNMLSRDGQLGDAVAVARGLSKEFPDNRELRRFLDAHGTGATR